METNAVTDAVARSITNVLDEFNLDDKGFARALKQLINAKKQPQAFHDATQAWYAGKRVPDHATRLKALEILGKLRGLQVDQPAKAGGAIEIKIVSHMPELGDDDA